MIQNIKRGISSKYFALLDSFIILGISDLIVVVFDNKADTCILILHSTCQLT